MSSVNNPMLIFYNRKKLYRSFKEKKCDEVKIRVFKSNREDCEVKTVRGAAFMQTITKRINYLPHCQFVESSSSF
jgi:hypothetical protein